MRGRAAAGQPFYYDYAGDDARLTYFRSIAGSACPPVTGATSIVNNFGVREALQDWTILRENQTLFNASPPVVNQPVELAWLEAGQTTTLASAIRVWPIGDVNRDAQINVFDSLLLAGHLVGNVPAGADQFPKRAAGNVQDDAVLDLFDVTYLQNYIVGNVGCLPVPADSGESLLTRMTGAASLRSAVKQAPSEVIDLDLDLSSVRLSGEPVNLGAYLVRVEFDPSSLEFIGTNARSEKGASRLGGEVVVTRPNLANEQGALVILGSDPLGEGAGGRVLIDSLLFSERKKGGMTTARAQVVQLVTGGTKDRSGRVTIFEIPAM